MAGPTMSSVCVAEALVVGSQSLSDCVDWSMPGVSAVACIPRCTRAGSAVCVARVYGRAGEAGSGDSSLGISQVSLGLVYLLTRMSHVAKRSRGGRVRLGGGRSRRARFQGSRLHLTWRSALVLAGGAPAVS